MFRDAFVYEDSVSPAAHNTLDSFLHIFQPSDRA
jgi:hypothetical protein